jgi:hypothetical protein
MGGWSTSDDRSASRALQGRQRWKGRLGKGTGPCFSVGFGAGKTRACQEANGGEGKLLLALGPHCQCMFLHLKLSK